jgi:hypothetical protein
MKRSSSVSYGTTCPFCRSSQSCRSLVSEMRTAPSFSAAVHADPIPAMSPDPVAHELHNFPSVFARHLRLGAFDVRLSRAASKGIFHKLHDERLCRILHLMAPAVDAFLSAIARGHWKPGSPWVICTSLRSYLRFRPLRGDDIGLVVSTLPLIAHWPHRNRRTYCRIPSSNVSCKLSMPTPHPVYAIPP